MASAWEPVVVRRVALPPWSVTSTSPPLPPPPAEPETAAPTPMRLEALSVALPELPPPPPTDCARIAKPPDPAVLMLPELVTVTLPP